MAWAKSNFAKRVAVWAGFIGLTFAIRGFYSIILGTFIMTLMGNQAVNLSQRGWEKASELVKRKWPNFKIKSPPRKAFCGVYILTLFCVLTTGTVLTVPRVIKEGQFVVSRISSSEDPYRYLADCLHNTLGDGKVLVQLENFLKSVEERSSISDQIFSGSGLTSARGLLRVQTDIAKGNWSPERAASLAGALQRLFKKNVVGGLRAAKSLVDYGAGALVTAGASLVFSSVLVWDFPAIAKGVQTLKNSRVGFAYREVTPKVTSFSKIVGVAFEIQILLALINTFLTGVGLLYLKIPATGFLSLLVFLCSFIPVAGIFLSTVPMLIIALSEYGIPSLAKVAVMVGAVHWFEAAFVYPPLYASKLKLHPLLVLVALYVTEHAVGVQGLFLALPVTVYATKVIMGNQGAAAVDEPTTV